MSQQIRLFVIGDSISIHYGPYLEKFLPDRFHYDRKRDAGAEKAEANLDIPSGANGGDSRMVLDYLRLRRKHSPIPADLLLLNCGLHDVKTNIGTGARQVSSRDYEENLEAILEIVKAAGWRLLWVHTTPVVDAVHNRPGASFHRHAPDVEAYNAIASRLMEAAGVATIDLHAFSAKFAPEGFCDHVHYNEEVRALQGAFIAGRLSAIA